VPKHPNPTQNLKTEFKTYLAIYLGRNKRSQQPERRRRMRQQMIVKTAHPLSGAVLHLLIQIMLSNLKEIIHGKAFQKLGIT
jgi:hypothetical protein